MTRFSVSYISEAMTLQVSAFDITDPLALRSINICKRLRPFRTLTLLWFHIASKISQNMGNMEGP